MSPKEGTVNSRARTFCAGDSSCVRRVVHESTAIKCDSWWEKKKVRATRRGGRRSDRSRKEEQGEQSHGGSALVSTTTTRASERASDAMPRVP